MEVIGIGVGIGPYLSVPYVSLNATQLRTSEHGANCEAKGETVQEFKDSYKNLTHVKYDVGIGGGIEFDFGIFGSPQWTIASKPWPLATQCLVYKSEWLSDPMFQM